MCCLKNFQVTINFDLIVNDMVALFDSENIYLDANCLVLSDLEAEN